MTKEIFTFFSEGISLGGINGYLQWRVGRPVYVPRFYIPSLISLGEIDREEIFMAVLFDGEIEEGIPVLLRPYAREGVNRFIPIPSDALPEGSHMIFKDSLEQMYILESWLTVPALKSRFPYLSQLMAKLKEAFPIETPLELLKHQIMDIAARETAIAKAGMIRQAQQAIAAAA